MQEKFEIDAAAIKPLRGTLGEPRLSRYLKESNGDEKAALHLYHWNTKLAQSLYLPLQTWEIALKNKISAILKLRFGDRWPYSTTFTSQLKSDETRRLKASIDRQERERNAKNLHGDVIIADLSAGFWVALLHVRYDQHMLWRSNFAKVFPYSADLSRADIHEISRDLVDLRNRVAHHEPIYHKKLDDLRADLDDVVKAMCAGSHSYINSACDFDAVWKSKP